MQYFTPDETLDYVSQIVLEIESLLKNPVLGRTYTEEVSDYRGVSRVIVKKFRIYYQQDHNDIVIVAILFLGEK
jgi:plasmid stabilization system protein ParE